MQLQANRCSCQTFLPLIVLTAPCFVSLIVQLTVRLPGVELSSAEKNLLFSS